MPEKDEVVCSPGELPSVGAGWMGREKIARGAFGQVWEELENGLLGRFLGIWGSNDDPSWRLEVVDRGAVSLCEWYGASCSPATGRHSMPMWQASMERYSMSSGPRRYRFQIPLSVAPKNCTNFVSFNLLVWSFPTRRDNTPVQPGRLVSG